MSSVVPITFLYCWEEEGKLKRKQKSCLVTKTRRNRKNGLSKVETTSGDYRCASWGDALRMTDSRSLRLKFVYGD